MSDARTDIDLSELARPARELPPPRRHWARVVVPLAILAGFGAVLASTLTDLFARTVEVTVVRPRAPRAGEARESAGQVVVQAAGWVEPDPFLVHVPALAGGVVEEVLVQESDVVEAGDVVARLVDDDARIDHDVAVAELAVRRAELAEAQARLAIAEGRLEAALEVTERAATAAAELAAKRAAAEGARAAVVQGEARLSLAEDEHAVQRELAAARAAGAWQVEIAEAAEREARGLFDALVAAERSAAAEVERAAAVLQRAEADRELRFDDRLEADLARARAELAGGEVRRAEAVLEAAALRLARMEIRAPAGGVVLERLTVPGMVLSVTHEGHAVCSLYDPGSLRVRVDVPEQDVARVFVGQRARIESTARPGEPYVGEVIRLAQLADIQKNTLEAQVRVEDGDALLRPDMLAQVQFLGREDGEGPEDGEADRTVLVPRRLVQGNAVWVVDAERDVAVRRTVELGAAHDDLVQVRAGLNLTDKLIDDGRAAVAEGTRVRVKEVH